MYVRPLVGSEQGSLKNRIGSVFQSRILIIRIRYLQSIVNVRLLVLAAGQLEAQGPVRDVLRFQRLKYDVL